MPHFGFLELDFVQLKKPPPDTPPPQEAQFEALLASFADVPAVERPPPFLPPVQSGHVSSIPPY